MKCIAQIAYYLLTLVDLVSSLKNEACEWIYITRCDVSEKNLFLGVIFSDVDEDRCEKQREQFGEERRLRKYSTIKAEPAARHFPVYYATFRANKLVYNEGKRKTDVLYLHVSEERKRLLLLRE